MWGASLFLLTIMLVVPSGRAALQEYFTFVFSSIAGQSSLSQIVLGLVVIVAVSLALLLRDPRPQSRVVYFVSHRGEPGDHEVLPPAPSLSKRLWQAMKTMFMRMRRRAAPA